MIPTLTPFACLTCGNQITVNHPMLYRLLMAGRVMKCEPCKNEKPLEDMTYKQYLKSPQWKVKAADCKAFWGNRCALCYSDDKPLHAHHRTYDRCKAEDATDLIALCEDCHRKFHGIVDK